MHPVSSIMLGLMCAILLALVVAYLFPIVIPLDIWNWDDLTRYRKEQ